MAASLRLSLPLLLVCGSAGAAESGSGVPLTVSAVSCHSVILNWPPADGASPPVLEYSVWFRRLSSSSAAEKAPIDETGAVVASDKMRRYQAEPSAESTRELRQLETGTLYVFEVRARTREGWHHYTDALSVTTMAAADFPLPILAPELSAFVGCATIKLALPTLRYCHEDTIIALEYRQKTKSKPPPLYLTHEYRQKKNSTSLAHPPPPISHTHLNSSHT